MVDDGSAVCGICLCGGVARGLALGAIVRVYCGGCFGDIHRRTSTGDKR